ncbi:single-stranded-DNA-specific exonuclease RecJ [Congregibacter litoralis]|uniref:Single-stranded-DNA-specific exonuclease RecJ n=1 Tax=Congregibacter litoralis KT71 TaxID=314285 RepID=A4ADF5_9GAMM|nr:single-stranded-DNA-specific exonuclease RecJ [Congregibacter litoralis]EAQ95953.1 single-stranded-DNA-specific exonuclease RecJ [Congregibacter litoralis KT71]
MSRGTRNISRRDCSGAESLRELPPILARVFAARGVQDAGELDLALSALHPPSLLTGLPAATERLHEALDRDERILIVGDFDADGATSTALAIKALRQFGASHVDYLVPNRFEFGYGLTPGIVALGAQRQPDLIITVDNGISSVDGVDAANALGIEVLITDHHLPGKELPRATAIVNPNQTGCAFPSKALAGVGVMFYLLLALRSRLRDEGWFARRGLETPHLGAFLDLVALGTVADVVPLDHNNRILVEGGLARMRSGRARAGINALLSVAGRDPLLVVASDLGFAAGPRLNAAGRLDDMSLGIECLLADDPQEARRIALQLDGMNRERQRIERGMEEEALAALAALRLEDADLPAALVLHDPHWHQGVVGILASRIKDRFHRPVIAFAHSGEGELKGSGRGIPGMHLRDLLDEVATGHPGLIDRFGGHAMAAGLSLPEAHFDDFAEAFTAAVEKAGGLNLEPVLDSDGELTPEDFDLTTAEMLRQAGPWGQMFPEPLFDGVFELRSQRIVGERHLKMSLAKPGDGASLDAIAFGIDVERWPDPSVKEVRLAYRLDVNHFRGERRLQLLVEQIEAL